MAFSLLFHHQEWIYPYLDAMALFKDLLQFSCSHWILLFPPYLSAYFFDSITWPIFGSLAQFFLCLYPAFWAPCEGMEFFFETFLSKLILPCTSSFAPYYFSCLPTSISLKLNCRHGWAVVHICIICCRTWIQSFSTARCPSSHHPFLWIHPGLGLIQWCCGYVCGLKTRCCKFESCTCHKTICEESNGKPLQ